MSSDPFQAQGPDSVNVQMIDDEIDTPEKLVDRYLRQLMTDSRVAALRMDARKLGIKHVFIVKNLGYVHIGEMNASVFTKLVGRFPERDDIDRVNCLRAGEGGHHMCGWCDDCGSPRFQCRCSSRRGVVIT